MDTKSKDQREPSGQIEPTPLLIVDSNYLCHRAKHSMGGLSHHEQATGVLFGFLNTVKSLALKFNSGRFVFAWDSQKSFRRKIYPAYKANRREEKSPEEKELDALAYPQFSLLRTEILPRLGFRNIFIRTGYEADDLIANLVNDGNPPEDKLVVANDDDLLQLLERCLIYSPATKKTMSRRWFETEYGIRPQLWVTVKALAGCSSDNIEGIYGVGEKKALAFIRGELIKGKIYEKILVKGEEIKKRNYPLVYLPFNGMETIALDDEEEFREDDFLDVFEEYGFRSFLRQDEFRVWKKIFGLR